MPAPAAPTGSNPIPQTPANSDPSSNLGSAGYILLLLAMVSNIVGIQELDQNALMGLTEETTQIQSQVANYWIEYMNGSNNPNSLSALMSQNTGNTGEMQVLSSEFNMANTQYNQGVNAWNGVSSGLQQTTTNITQSQQQDYQLIQQNSMTNMQTLVACL